MTLLSNGIVPVASVVSTATVAIWTKRIDARTKREDRQHELVLDYEKRAGEEKKAVLKSLISAINYVRRAAQLVGVNDDARLRAETIGELYEFRMRLGLDDGVAELMIYAARPVRDLTDLILDEWDRQFREHGYSLKQLDSCKKQLAQTGPSAVDGQQEWTELKNEEAAWLASLGEKSDLDVGALIALCDRTLEAAHKDLRGGYGVEW